MTHNRAGNDQGKFTNRLKTGVRNSSTPRVPKTTVTMLDVLDFIAERGGDPKKVKDSQKRRYAPEEIVDEVIELWQDARQTRYRADQARAEIGKVQKEIGQLKKAKQDADHLLKKKADLEADAKRIAEEAVEKEKARDKKCKTIGNYVHESVPLNDNEDFNEVIKTWAPEGVAVEKKECLSHHEVMTRAELYDGERGAKLVGHRGYFLRKWGVLLNQALINYGLHFLVEREYDPIQPPYFMNKDYMAKTAQLEQFDEELYKVVEGSDTDDKYLIATSEQPLSAMYADEWMTTQDLPKKFAGYSTCFRKEAGSHGRDAWGLYRIHQFEKVNSAHDILKIELTRPDRTIPLHETRRVLAGARRYERNG